MAIGRPKGDTGGEWRNNKQREGTDAGIPAFLSFEGDLHKKVKGRGMRSFLRSTTRSGEDDEQSYNTGLSSFTSSFFGDFATDDESSEWSPNGRNKTTGDRQRGRGGEGDKIDLWSRIGFLPLYADVKHEDAAPFGRKMTDSTYSEDIATGDAEGDYDDDSRYMMTDSDASTGTYMQVK